MMDRVVPGGVAADLARRRRRLPSARPCGRCARAVSAAGRALRQHRLAAGPHRRPPASSAPELARQFGAGGYVGRASGRTFDARKMPGYAPYDQLDFDVPVLDEGDVNARVWIRIREVEQSLALIEQILGRLPDGPIAVALDRDGGSGEGLGLVEGFRGDVLAWVRLDGDGASRAAICAIRPGFNGRFSKLRSKAISSPTFRSAINRSTARIRATICKRRAPCASILFESLDHAAAHGNSRRQPSDAALAELASARRPRGAPPARPQSLDPRGRRRLLQRLRA